MNINFPGNSNLLIHGDNLQILDYLCEDLGLEEKISLIYIDPPFSTNREFFVGKYKGTSVSQSKSDLFAYNDKLVGNEYFEFLEERLIKLRRLLSSEGSIYLHIDYKIGHYVKILMDDVFGVENFRNDITRIKCNPKNFERKNYGNIKDMILFYTKTNNYIWNNSSENVSGEEINKRFRKIDKKGRQYTTTPLHAPGETKNGDTGKMWKGLFPPSGRHWRYSLAELDRLNDAGLIEWSSTGNPRKIIFADEVKKNGKKRQDVWTFKDPQNPSYPTEKNLKMLKTIISASSNPGDIVLDAFCGSGTTLIASEMLSRRWIGIDNSNAAIGAFIKKYMKVKGHKEKFIHLEF